MVDRRQDASSVDGGRAHAAGRRAGRPGDATPCRCPPWSTVMEGGVEPRYPTITGRMKAKKVEVETRSPLARARGQRPGEADAAAAHARDRRGARRRAGGRARSWSTCCSGWGCAMILVLRRDLEPTGIQRGLPRDDHVRPRPCPRPATACRSTRSSSVRRRTDARRPSWRRTASATCTTPPATTSTLFSGAATATAVIAARRGGRLGGRDGRRHQPRQRGARARRHPPRRGDGRQRGVLPRALPVRRHPPGRRRRRPGGDAARRAPGGVHGRRPRGGACPCSRRRGQARSCHSPSSSPPRTCSSGSPRSRAPTPTTPTA